MTEPQTSEITFYQKIGELFYAIAAADKVVRKAEYDVLKDLVKNSWETRDHSTDEFGSEAVYQMEIVFDWFDYERMDADSCFDSFSEFYKEHPSIFTKSKKKLILQTAFAIANAFSGTNKSELILLTKLELLFKK